MLKKAVCVEGHCIWMQISNIFLKIGTVLKYKQYVQKRMLIDFQSDIEIFHSEKQK